MYIIYRIPRTCVEIIEIKYIYLTPILHTYTSRPYVYYVVNPITTTISLKCIRLLRRYTLAPPLYPLSVYAYCVDTHWHAAHYSPPTFDRPRSKRGDSSETSQRWRSSRQKKKIAAEPLRILTQSSLNKRTSNTLGLMMWWQNTMK
jgi:hypothetical protein